MRKAWARVTLVYTGTVQLAYQDPTPLFRAIGELVREGDGTCDDLRVLFFGGRNIGLQRLIEREWVADRVLLMGHVDRPTALWAQRHASALLLMDNQPSAARSLLRAKMFEYTQAGRPILGVGFDGDTEVGGILNEARVGRMCGADPGVILETLKQLTIGSRRRALHA